MDAIVLIIALLAISLPFIVAKLWWWVAFWIILSAVLGIFELISFLVTKKTISQQFWAWRKNALTPNWQKWAIAIGMIAFWVYLLTHLFI